MTARAEERDPSAAVLSTVLEAGEMTAKAGMPTSA
jgi:hypothetical protein